MNEHVKLLAEQAGLKIESWMTYPPKPFQIFGSAEQLELFAKLIVEECANIIQQKVSMKYTQDPDPALEAEQEEFRCGHYTGSLHARAAIKQHFGVK